MVKNLHLTLHRYANSIWYSRKWTFGQDSKMQQKINVCYKGTCMIPQLHEERIKTWIESLYIFSCFFWTQYNSILRLKTWKLCVAWQRNPYLIAVEETFILEFLLHDSTQQYLTNIAYRRKIWNRITKQHAEQGILCSTL